MAKPLLLFVSKECPTVLPTPFQPNQPKTLAAGEKVRPLIKYIHSGYYYWIFQRFTMQNSRDKLSITMARASYNFLPKILLFSCKTKLYKKKALSALC
jgi:hypothetical protein